MSSVSQYFKDLFGGIGSLLSGMSVTWKELFAKKVTQQYPENRKTLVISERFRGELIMPHDENNEHACTSCGICEMNCPNGTIKITSMMIETEEGRKKKILDQYHYDLSMCTFCNLCVITCPSDAIKFNNVFENAIFTRDKLNMRLNHEGSKLREKKKPQAKAETTVEKPVTKPNLENGPSQTVTPDSDSMVSENIDQSSVAKSKIETTSTGVTDTNLSESKPSLTDEKKIDLSPVVNSETSINTLGLENKENSTSSFDEGDSPSEENKDNKESNI